MGGGEGREGDWECNGCGNRNYAFRSFCNKCKQPRLLVDSKTPADSKWLPRIGDWICTGCTNNNYASREKCKKCGQPKELAAMPALAMPGPTLRTQLHYFPRAQGVQDHRLNMGLLNGALNQSLPLTSHWLLGQADKFGLQTATTWPLGGIGNTTNNTIPYINQISQVMVPKGWRNGDWICACGFHNYASRAQCKKCDASMPPALGTKRLASEELVQDWDNKRLNAGQTCGMQPSYPTLGQLPSSSYSTATQIANFVTHETAGGYPVGRSTAEQTLQLNLQTPQIATMPALPGKGTPTSRSNRPNTPQSQEDQELGFQAFTQQQGYRPHFSPQIPPQYPPQWSQQNPPQYFYNSLLGHPQQIPYQLTRFSMIEQGCIPTNFNPSSPFINLADDYVLETQLSTRNTPQSISTQQSIPEPSNSRPTKKGNRAAKQAWSKEEEVALVSAWVDVSEDPVVGNAQTGGSFWARIGHVFFTRLGREPGYRSTHQLHSKFNDLNKRINWFGGIYNNLANNRSSGMSEADISRTAHERYLAQYKVAFTHEQAWDVLKKCPKWGAVPTMTTTSSRGSKRTQPSDDDDVEQLQRPIGRNKAKKTSTSNTSGANTNESVTQLLTTFNDKIDDHMEYKMKKLDLKLKKLDHEQEIERAQRFEKDFKFFMTPHDHLTGNALSITLARKEQIKKFHNW